MANLNIKLDLSKIKDVLKGLSSLRTYSVLLVPTVIVIAGLLVLTGAILMGRSFRNTVNRESIPMGSTIKELDGKEEGLLVAKQVEAEKQYQDAYEQDANAILQADIESSQRELLSYDVLPKPEETSAMLFTSFGSNYRKGIEGLIAKINGKDSPSEEDFSLAGTSRASLRGPMATGPAGQPKEQEKIAEGICQARAKSISIYASPNDVSGYIFWERYQYKDMNSSVDDCWYWQQGYWIIEDIFNAVAAMNRESSTVYSSPVKRVGRIGFVSASRMITSGLSGTTVSQEKPKYVSKPAEQIAEPCTGRISNNDYNIIHFRFVAVIKANEIISFMKELCSAKEHRFAGYKGSEQPRVYKHNQISILETNIKTVEEGSADHKYYRYGYDSVKEVEFICEYIFNKKGYEPVNPAAVTISTAKSSN